MLVVKVGGSGGVDLERVCRDVARLLKRGTKLVLVHGGSREMDEISQRLGCPPRFVTTPSGFKSRYTDRGTLEIFVMVMAGRVNKLLVERLQAHGVNALGLSGLDGGLVRGRRKGTIIALENGKKRVLRGDYGGTAKEVNTPLLRLLLAEGYTPVVAPLAIGEESEPLNVDGDRVAAALAGALEAEALIILSNVPGLLKDPADEDSLIPKVPRAEARRYLERYAQGRMKKKLLSAIEALKGGVRRVVLADGRTETPISRALEGQGTLIE
ncbi:[LysW]-aminoadipate kinase [Candidatus Bipolaricaulota bacterium]|nr:[LysW]-aminoadipate kinase [Candidatus Bipolaricaulota bacterium]